MKTACIGYQGVGRISRFATAGVLGLLGLVLGAAGCASERYLYRPEENATARLAGRPAAYYSIPAQSPHGAVRVATLGIAKLEREGDEHSETRAMHVRMVVDNNDDTAPWQVDTRDQLGALDGYGQSRPAFAGASLGRPPILQIQPGASNTIDLYYPLPKSMQKVLEIPHFEVLWRVKTPETCASERTSFERVRVEPVTPPGYYSYGMEWAGPGGFGWYDPFSPDYAFWGSPVIYYASPPVVAAPTARRIR